MSETLSKKVLLIGWDAADWKVITPLMDAGKMPNLEKLVSNGVMGNLSTLYPVLSPMLWTSIATGKRGFKHGIHGFSEPDPQSGGVRPITNLGRKTKAIWNILNQQGMKSNVVGWWPSRPVEPINGVMVSDHFHKANASLDKPWPLAAMDVHPQRLIKPLAQYRVHPHELTPEQLLPFVPKADKIDQEKDKRLMSVAKVLAECASIQAAATAVMQLEEWDFMGVYFDAIDHFCHGFMKYHPPRQDWILEEDFELYKDVVNGAYQFHDMMLGTMMELVDDETTIMIVSDHGFHPDHLRPKQLPNEPAGPAEEHRHFGMIAAMGPGIKKDELIFGANLLDVTPTILALMGMPIGRDMDGKPLVDAFDQSVEIDYVDSWDQIEGDAGLHPADQTIDPVDNHEAMQQLVELGYIDKPDEDQATAVAQTVRELRHNLGRDYMDALRYVDAMPIFEKLWQKWPDESRFGVKLFDCQLALSRCEAAEETLNKIIEQKKRYAAEAQEALKKLQEEWKDRDTESLTDQERKKLNKLRVRASFNMPTLAFLQGRLFYEQGKHGDAMVALREAEKAQMHNLPSLYAIQGNVLIAMRRFDDAEKKFKKILEIDPVSDVAHSGLCRVYLGCRQNKKALAEAQASLGLIYHNPQMHLWHGICLHRLGRLLDAVDAIKIALSQNPVFPEAHKRLAQIYLKRLNQPELAVEHQSMAKESRKRVRDFKAGKALPDHASVDAMMRLHVDVSLGNLGLPQQYDPLDDDEIVIVSGLPRSGTSMMMQMLDAGGLTILTDEVRKADQSNPKGYYEFEKVKSLAKETDWLEEAEGKVVKVIAQLLPKLDQKRRYRIIFMERHIQEILNSQSTMLKNKDSNVERDKNLLAETYSKQVNGIHSLLDQHSEKIKVLSVQYQQALESPGEVVIIINEFLGGTLNETAMLETVDLTLYRQRLAS